ncbi:MAG TPA: hypothetical protein PK801_09825 [Aggregatilineales bacterium]|nr:response regulator transcription factor [Chloroflexota bacterium]HOA25194.1 hypothetical protein [Aggregatilineales bacterium]HPV07280.1 hypothetical protein [Aggregatilineales bacterium]HQA68611.1 hypothetical protein [Aggregatilineales bacterium]
MERHSISNITTALISRDPFFLFTARALLGRDRRVRIYDTASALADLGSSDRFTRLQALVCDLDTAELDATFPADLSAWMRDNPRTKVLCLAEGRLAEAARVIGDLPVHALLSKNELGYCLHLAVHAVVEENVRLLTERSHSLLPPNAALRREGRLIAPERPHPNLTERIAEVAMWRIFIGLDNPDIRDELLLGDDTVRGYVSTAYQALGANNELEAFEALSNWWWITRFEEAVHER